MATLLFGAFLVYLYVPYLIFKFFADLGIDLGSKRDTTKVEEFFGAAAPSFVLNAFTYAVLRVASTLHIIRFPPIDWRVVACVFDGGDKFQRLFDHFSVTPAAEIRYLVALYIFAAAHGMIYGQTERRLILNPHGRTGWRSVTWAFAVYVRKLVWSPFFADQIVWFSTVAMQDLHAFIRTKDSMLFYGQVWIFTKNRAGEIDTCILVDVQRFSRQSVTDCIEKMRNPLRKLHGSLVIKWSEVMDANFVTPDVMVRVRRRYANQLRRRRRAKRAEVRANVASRVDDANPWASS